MFTSVHRVVGLGLVAIVLSAGLAGCSTAPTEGVAIVTGSHANAPTPDPAPVIEEYGPDITNGFVAVVVRIDGHPEPVFSRTYDEPASTPVKDREKLRAAFADDWASSLEESTAVEPETATLDAIAVAARALTASGTRTMHVFDSMVQTSGSMPLDGGRLADDPVDIVEGLRESGQLPDLTGIDLVLHGFGQVAEPQQVVGEADRTRLEQLWRAVFTAAAARSVTILETVPGAEPSSDLPTVTPIALTAAALPERAPECDRTQVHDALLGFAANSGEFIDKPSAIRQVQHIAEQLTGCRGRLSVSGTTSSAGTPESRADVAEARALAVARLLSEALGIPFDDIRTHGLGMEFEGYVDDRDDQGHLIESAARLNRSVLIEFAPPA